MRVIIGLLLCLPLVLYVAPVGGKKIRKRCKPLTFPDTIRSCDQEPNAEGWYRHGTVCNFDCRVGCVKDIGSTRRVCKVKGRSKWWTGGRGLKCRCHPCVGAPSHPEGYTSDCGAGTYPAGHTCVFTCPAGYVKASGSENKLCVNGHWRGEDLVCEETDECISYPCANGATCEDGVDGYTCSCAPGYEGDHCEAETDECMSNPCANGATCHDEIDGYTCTCAPGYEGVHCETETDECMSNPCANGATCHDEVDGYTCTCAPGYEGVHCETETDECISYPCANGATCEDEVDGYTCTCAPGYEGDHCETEETVTTQKTTLFSTIPTTRYPIPGDSTTPTTPMGDYASSTDAGSTNSWTYTVETSGYPCYGAPSHPEGYTSNCHASQYEFSAGHTCVFSCPVGYVQTSGDSEKLCENGQWRGEDLVCEGIVGVSTFLNPHDPLLVLVTTAGGNVIQVQGNKTEEGAATSVESITQTTAGGDKTTVGFSPDSALVNTMVTSSGVSMTFTWTDDKVFVTASAQNSSFELNVQVALEPSDLSPGSALPEVNGTATGSATEVVQSLRLPVLVTMCELPTDNVTVTAFGYKGLTSATDVSSLDPDVAMEYRVFKTDDAGQFEIVVPASPANSSLEAAQTVCDSVSQVVGGVCAAFMNIRPATDGTICNEVADAAQYITTQSGAESALLLAACSGGFGAVQAFCNAFAFNATEEEAIASSNLCQQVTETVDSFTPDPVLVVPTALFVGGEKVSVPGKVVLPGNSSQTLPAFNISSNSSAVISSVDFTPRDPEPGESYVAYAQFLCTDVNTVVTMRINGTDGYMKEVQCVGAISGCTLYVPGAEALVMDRVTTSIYSGAMFVVSLEEIIIF